MPLYDWCCKEGCERTEYMSYADYDRARLSCDTHKLPMRAKVNKPVFYGAWRINDKTFRDAEEATGETIKSTKDIDRLEKQGVIRAVTNPSTYQFKNGKKLGKL